MLKKLFLLSFLLLTACQSQSSKDGTEQTLNTAVSTQTATTEIDQQLVALRSQKTSFFCQTFSDLKTAQQTKTITIGDKTYSLFTLESLKDMQDRNYYFVIYTEDKETH